MPAPDGDEEERGINSFQKTVREAGKKILGYKRRKNEKWIQQGTWGKIVERILTDEEEEDHSNQIRKDKRLTE